MQATLSASSSKGGLTLMMIIAIILVALCIAFLLPWQPNMSSHAAEKHGSAAYIVRDCMKDADNIKQIWYNPSTNRKATICQIAESKFGVMIHELLDGGNENPITSFIKDKMKRIEQVGNNLRNQGYHCVTGC